MSGVFGTIGKILSPIGGLLFGKKPADPPSPLPIPTRDDAAAATQRDDELRRRRGTAADQLLGPAGAEAPTVSAKTLTGQ